MRKRRPTVGRGEGFGVLLRLIAGAKHGLIPAGSVADGGTAAAGEWKEGRGLGRGTALLGFEDEAGTFVEIDAAVGGRAGRVAEGDGTLEDVIVVAVVGEGGIGTGDFEIVAELGEE